MFPQRRGKEGEKRKDNGPQRISEEVSGVARETEQHRLRLSTREQLLDGSAEALYIFSHSAHGRTSFYGEDDQNRCAEKQRFPFQIFLKNFSPSLRL
jgi:hypothetical protein